MKTLPKIALFQISQLRRREQLYRLIWGLARVFTLSISLLALAMFIDCWVDRYRDTPYSLRLGMTIVQLLALALASWCWILRPLTRQLSDSSLAAKVERELPEFGHRLVTAIQLTHPKALTLGMSEILIEEVTVETEALAGKHRFASLADTQRLYWSLQVMAIPIFMIIGCLIAFRFDMGLVKILLERQLLLDVDIPHFIQLGNATRELWPLGDEVAIEYSVTGRIDENLTGLVRIYPEGMPHEEYLLKFLRWDVPEEVAIYGATIPPSTIPFSHRSWLGDGRTKDASQVRFEPRPVVNRIDARVEMPDFIGKKPDGTAYETYQSQGEVSGMAGSKVHLQIQVQKPFANANLVLLSRKGKELSEVESAPIPMTPGEPMENESGETVYPAKASFQIAANHLAYRIDVIDPYGFKNANPPRRGINLSQDEPPRVTLLPERFANPGEAASEATEVDGMPIPIGGKIRVSYLANSPLGLSRARFVYRVNEGTWNYLNLDKVKPTAAMGAFDPRQGAYVNSKTEEQIGFTTLPSQDATVRPNDLEGGGRFDFETGGLKKTKPDGKQVNLEVGDRLEFHIEVFDKNPARGRLPGISETRIKGIVSDEQFVDWVVQTLQSESRLKQLEEKQRGIFGKKKE